MTKKHFIALADTIIKHNSIHLASPFTILEIWSLVDFCRAQNPNFDEDLWVSYINGECGPNGGPKKPVKPV